MQRSFQLDAINQQLIRLVKNNDVIKTKYGKYEPALFSSSESFLPIYLDTNMYICTGCMGGVFKPGQIDGKK